MTDKLFLLSGKYVIIKKILNTILEMLRQYNKERL